MVQEKQKENSNDIPDIHEHHSHALFFLFCLVTIVAVAAVLFGHSEGNAITGAVSAKYTFSSCVDNGNFISLSHDSGKRIKKDRCTGMKNKFLQKAACVLVNDPADPDYGEYTFTYTKIALCDSGALCARDENRAAYCPGDKVVEPTVP